MIASLGRLATLRAETRVIPGHGAATTIGDELPWISDVVASGRLQVTRP